MSEATVTLNSQDEAISCSAPGTEFAGDSHGHRVQVVARGDTIVIRGSDEQVDQVRRVLRQLRGW